MVVGIVLAAFSLPAIVAAWSDRRSPRAAAIVLVIGLGTVAVAIFTWPGPFGASDVPEAFVKVAGSILN
ncbi:hypothetical protein DDZ14_10245 [Maritimibacter sp. 55A14]|nr:hypothetical protein DDZ14_10245 [Maritimibacter sp. 55A14]